MFFSKTSHVLQLHALRGGLLASSHALPSLATRWAMRLFATPTGPRRIRYDFSRYPGFQEITLSYHHTGAHEPVRGGVHGRLRGYTWGRVDERPVVVLLHGWSGWGLQLGAFVEPLLEAGFAVAAFDLPAHGRSSGRQATLPLCTAALAAIVDYFPQVHAAIGHSFGGAVLAYGLTHGVALPHVVMISAPAGMESPLQHFARTLRLPPRLVHAVQRGWERKLKLDFGSLRAEAMELPTPTRALLVHDRDDDVIVLDEMRRYQARWPTAAARVTEGLGHREILRDRAVIADVVRFLCGAAPHQTEHGPTTRSP